MAPQKLTKKQMRHVRPNARHFMNHRTKLVKQVIAEISGSAPYEKRIIELLRVGKEKRALKFAKARLGTHKRALKKRSMMEHILQKEASKHHH
ncbi:putative large subunit ribosomal protein L36e [Blattamonas nauphoetae]|uniref:60S ribosomal protein L36 n=1 Tax=Blattamonas nauphoetae TaxID=2049346 RepID=A0ABQ9Y680_9EUKA|nr:putative large subunit ribosomal protein L36e [Blattamonas nauphoetae]